MIPYCSNYSAKYHWISIYSEGNLATTQWWCFLECWIAFRSSFLLTLRGFWFFKLPTHPLLKIFLVHKLNPLNSVLQRWWPHCLDKLHFERRNFSLFGDPSKLFASVSKRSQGFLKAFLSACIIKYIDCACWTLTLKIWMPALCWFRNWEEAKRLRLRLLQLARTYVLVF